jgi:hypothetical protein
MRTKTSKKKTRCLSSSSIDNEMDSIASIASDIWNELVEASRTESLLNTKPFYDVIVKIEDPTNSKIMLDFKRLMEMSLEEYKSLPAKNNWNSNVKYSLLSIKKDLVDCPICLCHLVMLTAYKLKVFGDDAFGKVSSCCKVGAGVIHHILETNTVFFPVGAIRSDYHVCPLNEEPFKAAFVDMQSTKMASMAISFVTHTFHWT